MCTKQAENPANVWGRLGDAVATVAAIDSSALAGEAAGEQLLALRPLIDQLEAVFSGLAARFDASGAHEQAGARTAPAWLRRELRLGAGEARRTVALGRALPLLPGTATALAAGEIGLAHAQVMASALEQVGATTIAEAEDALLSVARLTDPAGLREAVKALREALDPDALERDYVKALGRRQVSCVPVGAGFHLSGFLDAESGAIVATAINARIRPSGPDDRRRIGERRADALADICRESLDAGTAAKDGGIRPHLSLTVDWSRFGGTSDGRPRPPACHLEGFGPIPDTLVRKLGCDAGVSRIVTDPDGAPLNLGRTARTAQPHQRRGIRVRDRRRCRTPGCDNRSVQIHHVKHWIDGGDTDIDSMVSACPRCHTLVHLGLISIETHGGGRFTYRDRHRRVMADSTREAENITQEYIRTLGKPPARSAEPARFRSTDPDDLRRRRLQLRL